MDYRLNPPEDPDNWCDEHECEMIADADEDGVYYWCPECKS